MQVVAGELRVEFEAEELRQAAEARLAQYEEKRNAARAEATDIVAEGRRDAEAVKQKSNRSTAPRQAMVALPFLRQSLP